LDVDVYYCRFNKTESEGNFVLNKKSTVPATIEKMVAEGLDVEGKKVNVK
jgi:hypothetical protein